MFKHSLRTIASGKKFKELRLLPTTHPPESPRSAHTASSFFHPPPPPPHLQPSTLSLKARHTTAFWWPLYSLLISPVSTHHRRARLSEEAVGWKQESPPDIHLKGIFSYTQVIKPRPASLTAYGVVFKRTTFIEKTFANCFKSFLWASSSTAWN